MTNLTPMMAQYKQIKARYEDCILMYRLGDFYEMFFEDAKEAAKILQIALTARGKNGANATPMCGVPFHAIDGYLAKLTRAGKKVAIADQVTVPDGKGIVEREVIRVVTPGTTFDENILDGKANNFVSCVVREVSDRSEKYAFAFSDVTTGEFRVTEVMGRKNLEAEMMKTSPAECVGGSEMLGELDGFLRESEICGFSFDYGPDAERELLRHFEVQSLEVFGLDGRALAVRAAGTLFEYLRETQKTDLKHIRRISFYQVSEYMALDESMIRNLELFHTTRDGKKEGSLIWVLDQTVTAMGGRLIRNWLINPLLDRERVVARHEKVSEFVADSRLMREVREVLSGFYDMERLLSRLSLGAGNARDLIAMKESLKLVPKLRELCAGYDLDVFDEPVSILERAILDEPAASVRDGGMIRAGFDSELDDLRAVSGEGKGFIGAMEERERKRTGISSLKVRFNKVFGYYIEISNTNLKSVPDDYIRKQTLVNAERFITPELKEYEDKVLGAEDRIKELEYELFYKVRMEVVKEIVKIQRTARSVAEIDVMSTFAFNAEKYRYCRPEIVESGLEIRESRHAVVERICNDFVPNDCVMGADRNFLLITGPNMGGKSTYLRQVALICLMAQIGSFVPASSARLGLVDRIFTRVGASDNLVRGQSTFMVEMQEASYILNQATERSLIILDEIGRGTSTYDGVSIAWAIMEYIHDKIGAKTIFATHYHELIELADSLSGAVNLSVAVRENRNEGVVFLYRVVEGGVDKSYGIEVAKLAGLPVDVVGRARGVLRELETKHIKKRGVSPDQSSIFERDAGGLSEGQKKVMEALLEVDLNAMTPMEAMRKLSDMKDVL